MVRKLLAGIGLLALLSTPALAQGACAPIEEMAKLLEQEFKERAIFRGESVTGWLTLVLTNPDTGTYTIIQVNPEGIACVRDGGQRAKTIATGTPS